MLPKFYTPPHLRKQPKVYMATVLKAVEQAFGVPVTEIKSDKRHVQVARARQAACYLMRRHCPDASFLAIARSVGRQDHTTALHSIAVIENMMRRDAFLADKVWNANAIINESKFDG